VGESAAGSGGAREHYPPGRRDIRPSTVGFFYSRNLERNYGFWRQDLRREATRSAPHLTRMTVVPFRPFSAKKVGCSATTEIEATHLVPKLQLGNQSRRVGQVCEDPPNHHVDNYTSFPSSSQFTSFPSSSLHLVPKLQFTPRSHAPAWEPVKLTSVSLRLESQPRSRLTRDPGTARDPNRVLSGFSLRLAFTRGKWFQCVDSMLSLLSA
jgi:hypothetical protein